MARPKKNRRICTTPAFSCFKPNGVPLAGLETVNLLAEELEALRLADMEGLSQQESADSMGISRQTFGNMVNRARHKVALCLVHSHALMLEPGQE